MTSPVSLPAAITGIRTLRDKTVRLTVDCQECLPEYMAELFAMNDKQGWFFFHEQPIKEIPADLPEIKVEQGEKTPGARLRGVLFILWEQTKSTLTFEQFYRERMEQLITMIKDKLN